MTAVKVAQKTVRRRSKTTLAAAVAHRVRVKCLVVLAERIASPAEIAREFHLNVTNVSYHIEVLEDAGLIELVDEKTVRGSTEHFYRATEHPLLSEEDEAVMSHADRTRVAENILGVYAASAAHAIEAGTLLARPDHHLTRQSMNLDEKGWKRVVGLHMELFNAVMKVQEASTERLKDSGEIGIRAVSYQSFFEMPPPR